MDSTCELDIATDEGIEVLGDAINQYVQWHRRDIILQGCSSQELQPGPEANIEYAALFPVPEENNREQDQTTLVGNDRVDDFPHHDPTPVDANIETRHPVLPSPKSATKITEMPSPQAPPKMPKIPRMITTYGKAPSAYVDKFLRAMNNPPSSFKNKEKAPLQKDFDVRDLFSYEVEITPENYEHGKSFLPHVDLQLSPWELIKFHAWIMKAMKHGIKEITAMVPPSIFNNPVPHQIVIDFEDLHRLYRRRHMDVNLVTVFCLMQWQEEVKTQRHKVAYLDPARIHQTEHNFKLNEKVQEQLKAVKTKKAKYDIKEEAHKKERHKVSVYIAKVMLKRVDKDWLMAPYGFDNHWIAIMIIPKIGRAVVLDSADYDRKQYREFIGVLQNAYRLYVMKGRPHPPDWKEIMNIRYNFHVRI
ncbi:hypothetical protein PVAP13_9KG144300 [Panicum virgatum]|uniref:Ubiquitin-like protease family profile domain-containing protein n=2 Tax=Panicum virgatum TaxID=38727 RepID=A0A8T0NDZ0_PANVG|nr:hypothetical protein PVAP13_9KG144300 [Panicum virgatum]